MKFSIIVPHYDRCITDIGFSRGIKCLLDQTFQDFEVLIYHDGPTSRDTPETWKNLGKKAKFEITEKRFNDFGHSNRDKGIREAKGDYIIHYNPDNILYPPALEFIAKEIDKTKVCIGNKSVPNDIVVFPIIMRGMVCNGIDVWRTSDDYANNFFILTGFPPLKNNIDCMQLVMKTSIWRKEGGWYNKNKDGDGEMYPKFIKKYSARYCSEILGEHW